MKNMLKKITHIIRGWYYSFIGVNYELGQQRLKHCNVCSHHLKLTKNIYVCDLCGCVTSKKVLVPEEKCLEQKW